MDGLAQSVGSGISGLVVGAFEAIGRALHGNPAFGVGSGDLSVHEVAMSLVDPRLGYLSYYAGGFRVIRIIDDEIVGVGHYVADDSVTTRPGNNFWGVQLFEHEGHEYIAASDRDSGLWIFEYTGD